MTKKHSIEYVREQFENRGYTLLSTEYKNNKQMLEYVCPNHPNVVNKTRFNSLVTGQGCPYCAGNVRLTYSEVKSCIDSEGFRLISESYKNNHTPLNIQCPKHEDTYFGMSFKDFKNGHRCPKCKADDLSNRTRGENHYAWKGLSDLTLYLRKHTKEWTYEVLKLNNFKCHITGDNLGDLEVHHLKPFNLIRDEALNELSLDHKERVLDYNAEELESIVGLVKQKHNVENGIPLRKSIHTLFHQIYGNQCTPEDYYEFKQHYLNEEFSEIAIS